MSDTVPSSSPEAAASCMTPLRPAVMDAASHPAMLIYCMASDASCAVNFVAAPISLAFAVRDSISLAVAPESASTVDMEDWKSPAMVMQSMYAPPISCSAAATPAAAIALCTAPNDWAVFSPKVSAPLAACSCWAVSSASWADSLVCASPRSSVLISAPLSASAVAPSFCFCRVRASSAFLIRCSSLSFSRLRDAVEPVVSSISVCSSACCFFRLTSLSSVAAIAPCCFWYAATLDWALCSSAISPPSFANSACALVNVPWKPLFIWAFRIKSISLSFLPAISRFPSALLLQRYSPRSTSSAPTGGSPATWKHLCGYSAPAPGIPAGGSGYPRRD